MTEIDVSNIDCSKCGTPAEMCSWSQNPTVGRGDCCADCSHVNEPDVTVTRSLVETYRPDGVAIYEYTSENHAVRIMAQPHIDRAGTEYVLQKISAWVARSPNPRTWVEEDSPF